MPWSTLELVYRLHSTMTIAPSPPPHTFGVDLPLCARLTDELLLALDAFQLEAEVGTPPFQQDTGQLLVGFPGFWFFCGQSTKFLPTSVDAERGAQPVHRGPRRVMAGVPVHVAGDR